MDALNPLKLLFKPYPKDPDPSAMFSIEAQLLTRQSNSSAHYIAYQARHRAYLPQKGFDISKNLDIVTSLSCTNK